MTRRVEAFSPLDPERVTFYSCGPTVYDDAHIGNFRSFLAADVLRRWIESPWCEVQGARGAHRGPRRVVHVMNITDVGHMTDDAAGGESGEDRMAVAGRRLAEAKKSGKLPAGVEVDPGDPRAIARFYEARFLEDARALGLKVAIEAKENGALMPRATENVAGMIEVVSRLVERGYAYVTGEAGRRVVYFDVRKFGSYGRLSGNTLDELREGEGGRVSAENQAGKRHPADFLLWKEDPAHIMRWESPWGAGYPGWHIECTVMALRGTRAGGVDLKTFTAPDGEALFDLHSGGEDNIFPHHECEVAQSCAAFNETPEGAPLARMWFHPRFLVVNGEKMSKSKGNFFTARDLFEKGHEAAAVRMELIKTHHRSNANFTEQGVRDSARMLERWRRVLDGKGDASAGEEGRRWVRDEFSRAMDDDLNVAGAIAAVNSWINGMGEPSAPDAETMREMDRVLGLLERERPAEKKLEIGVFAPGVEPDAWVIERLEARRKARADKDFRLSDAIRDELLSRGFAIKDIAGGKVEVRRAGT